MKESFSDHYSCVDFERKSSNKTAFNCHICKINLIHYLIVPIIFIIVLFILGFLQQHSSLANGAGGVVCHDLAKFDKGTV